MTARADRVWDLVESYRTQHDDHEDDATVLVDMLADLFHWADMVGVDLDEALATARMHHDAERLEDSPVTV